MNEVAKMKPESAQEIAPQDASLVSMIEKVALNPNLPIERLEQMMALKERMDDRQREDDARMAERSFYADMAKAQGAIPVVIKTRNNSHTKSSYADLAAIEEQAMPIIREHGFAIMAGPLPGAENGCQRVRLKVTHRDGHCETFEDDFPLDAAGSQGKSNKTGIQAKGSTITYARRYLTCGAFNIATGDNDGNSAPAEPAATISEAQYREIRDLIEAAGLDEGVICRAEAVDNLTELPAGKFNIVAGKLRQTKSEGK